MNILETKNLSKEFDGLLAVNNLSISLERGRITSLIGPNGAGKTTVFNILTGFLAPDTGDVIFNGKRIAGLAPHRIARMGMGRMFTMKRMRLKATKR